MNDEIKLDLDKQVGWHVLPDELRALSCGDYDGKDMPLGLPSALRYLADSIEEQVKPAVEEPTEFGSIVRARDTRDGKPEKSGLFWVRQQAGWFDDVLGRQCPWRYLTDVEVLRVGIGEPAMAPAQQNAQVWQSLTGRVIRFCMRSQNCRMADGHDGGCQS